MPPLEELETSYGTCSFWRAIGCPASPPPLHPHHFSCSPRSSRSRAHQRLRHRCFSRMRSSSAAGTVSGSERRHRVHGAPRRLSESRRSCRRWRDHELVASHWVGAAWREVASFVAAREARRSGRSVCLPPGGSRRERGSAAPLSLVCVLASPAGAACGAADRSHLAVRCLSYSPYRPTPLHTPGTTEAKVHKPPAGAGHSFFCRPVSTPQ